MNQVFYKVLKRDRSHHDFRYVDGLNKLKVPFNSDPTQTYGPGRLYFTSIENILKFVDYGHDVYEVTLPISDENFEFVKFDDKYGANMIILGKKFEINIETYRYLIEKGADIHADNENLLMTAIVKGEIKLVKLLVEKGADIHVNNEKALKTCIENEQFNIMLYLIRSGAVPSQKMLEMACEKGFFGIVRRLLSQPNIMPTSSSLLIALARGHLKISKYLIRMGADLDSIKDDVLDICCRNNHLDVVKFLLYKGAKNKNALVSAIMQNNFPIVRLLIRNGYKNDEAFTVSAYYGDLSIIKLLVKSGCNIHINDEALPYAINNNKLEAAKYFISLGLKMDMSKIDRRFCNEETWAFVKKVYEKNNPYKRYMKWILPLGLVLYLYMKG